MSAAPEYVGGTFEDNIAASLRERLAKLNTEGIRDPSISISSRGNYSVCVSGSGTGDHRFSFNTGHGDTIDEALADLRKEIPLPKDLAQAKELEAAKLLEEARKLRESV